MTIWTINIYIFIAAVIITFLFAQLRKPKSFILDLLKNFIGSYFVFSGIVKAVDPVGTSIKMEEYFEIFHEYFPWFSSIWSALEPVSLGFSVFTILLEIFLGLFLIVGAYRKLTTYMLLLTIVFFTFLTGFSHLTGKVTDCGCFGDFLLLTPKVSFLKDVFLTALIIPLVIFWKKLSPLFSTKPRNLALLILGILSVVFTLRNVHYEPIVDFRAYTPGTNIVECLQLPPDAKPYIFENLFTYKNNETGKSKEFKIEDLPADLENWTFIDRKDKLIQKGDDPKCKDFAINDANGNDLTSIYMEDSNVLFVMIIPSLKKMDSKNLEHVIDIFTEAKKDHKGIVALTGSDIQEVSSLLKTKGLAIDVFNTDDVPLKTIMRSNPGVLVLRQGTILGKYHHNDEVTYKNIKDDLNL